jgi:hypothetical protein
LSDVTNVDGDVSLSIDGAKWPAGDFRHGELAGTLSLHDVEVGPGPVVKGMADIFHIPQYKVRLAHESTVGFELANGRVRHEGLEFGLGDLLKVRTSGTIGLDETLDLVALVRVHVPVSAEDTRPLLQELNKLVIKLPIHGTLKQPQFDVSGLKPTLPSLLEPLADKLRQGELGPAKELLDKLREPNLLKPGSDVASEASAAAVDASTAAIELLGGLIERRRERNQQRAVGPSETAPPRQANRPLGKLLDRLRPRTPENSPAPPAPPPVPPAVNPVQPLENPDESPQ